MASFSDLLSQCVEMTHQLVKTKQKATINIKIGIEFQFQFCNQEDEEFPVRKRLSPSQRKRNWNRRSEFEEKRKVENSDVIKLEAEDCAEEKVKTKDAEAQTASEERIGKTDRETQTNLKTLESVGVNTNEAEIESFENIHEIDENGQIHPRKDQVLVEMKVKPRANNWQEIESCISENLQLTLLGKPWISNNGNHYMTIGFRTKLQEFENWKIRTFNWQDSGVRAVSTSRIYR